MCAQAIVLKSVIVLIGGIFLIQGLYILAGFRRARPEKAQLHRPYYRLSKGLTAAVAGAILIIVFTLPVLPVGERTEQLLLKIQSAFQSLDKIEDPFTRHAVWGGILVIFLLLVSLGIRREFKKEKNLVRRWAENEGFEILSSRGVPGWDEVSQGLLCNSDDEIWKFLTLKDKAGKIRRARVCFGNSWDPDEVVVYWEKPNADELIEEAKKERAASDKNPDELLKPRW